MHPSVHTETIISLIDVTISLQEPSELTSYESGGNIEMCAILNGPSGGLRSAVNIQFVISGQNPGNQWNNYRIFILMTFVLSLIHAVIKIFPFLASVGTTQCTNIVIDNEIYEESPKQLTVSLSSSHSRVTASGMVTLNIIDNDSSYNMIIIFVHIPNPQNEYLKRRFKQYIPRAFDLFTHTYIILIHSGVTVSMQTASIEQNENRGVVSVCAILSGPSGGLGIPVTVQFTPIDQNPGNTFL